jgi:hypothetical protein
MQDEIEKIAQKILNIKTLKTQNSDELDFHNISVWNLKEALEEAYKAGEKYNDSTYSNKINQGN